MNLYAYITFDFLNFISEIYTFENILIFHKKYTWNLFIFKIYFLEIYTLK